MTSKKKTDKIDVRFGSKDQVLWESVLKEAKVLIEQSENNLKIQTEIKKLAEAKIKEEENKWQTKQH